MTNRDMAGERDLGVLLASLEPVLLPETYVYTVVEPAALSPNLVAVSKALVRENEGVSCVLPQSEADRLGLAYDVPMAWISLTVHSSLEVRGWQSLWRAGHARR